MIIRFVVASRRTEKCHSRMGRDVSRSLVLYCTFSSRKPFLRETTLRSLVQARSAGCRSVVLLKGLLWRGIIIFLANYFVEYISR